MAILASVANSIVEYLDRHFGAASVLLTIVLIAVTAYYATQNRRMVKEMAKARDLSVMPKLALEFHRLGPTAMDIAIRNVGLGTAIAIDVRLTTSRSEMALLRNADGGTTSLRPANSATSSRLAT